LPSNLKKELANSSINSLSLLSVIALSRSLEKIDDPDVLNLIAAEMVDVVAKIGGLNNVLEHASTPTGANY
jgi:hypothetical protein